MGIALWLEQNVGYRILMLHDKLYKSTDGRIGHKIPLPGVAPSLLLHTVGAKTGKQRTNTLSYFPDGGSYYVVASKGGDPKAPGWYHNLKANPDVEINVGPQRFAVTATPLLPEDADYARMWKVVNDGNSNRYNGYQKRTTRPIPIVRLTPCG
ncbi:nitroreductase family deazaflavin-dependent oxidoreductase [Mycobacterium sp. 236(2023)]|uniref:nitroreductase family deazaflavin-dependent oxidoreductase n=1 Tax=Mycobacterium sp. 236(2023) TaxID=3038163 RepID=UPI002415013C|nr:nitroreductase family deazaflavin-dependent oxidoreductase [Mycobacterium sp. 236(2023)]MDG4666262.1 nitroreductase family deazaflavin-dependent oxidoreductase [Mycobacterium sp. 236(2023)]